MSAQANRKTKSGNQKIEKVTGIANGCYSNSPEKMPYVQLTIIGPISQQNIAGKYKCSEYTYIQSYNTMYQNFSFKFKDLKNKMKSEFFFFIYIKFVTWKKF